MLTSLLARGVAAVLLSRTARIQRDSAASDGKGGDIGVSSTPDHVPMRFMCQQRQARFSDFSITVRYQLGLVLHVLEIENYDREKVDDDFP